MPVGTGTTTAKAFTPDPNRYHELEEIGHLYRLPGSGTLLPVARGIYHNAHMPVDPKRPRKLIVDPGLPGGGYELDLDSLTTDKIKAAIEDATHTEGVDAEVDDVVRRLATGGNPGPKGKIKTKLRPTAAPEAVDLTGGAAKERSRRGGDKPPEGLLTAAMVHQTVKVSSRRPAPPPQPVAATPAPQAAPMLTVSAPAPLHLEPASQMAPYPQQGWPPSGPMAQPAVLPLGGPYMDVPPLQPLPAAPMQSLPAFPPFNGQATPWAMPQQPAMSQPSFAGPPTVDLLLDTGALGLGAFGTRFHQVKAENGFLVMVYDNRYDGPGQRWVPPKLDPSQRLTAHVPSLQRSFQVSLHGMHFSVDHYDVFLAVVHQAASHGQPQQQNGLYQ